jgi:glyoxylase-like metal-dependent hydrolase (beta-lactamase superfamily II)
MSASVHVLQVGYLGEGGPEGMRVGSSITYIAEGEVHVVVDPGLAPSHGHILDPLRGLGVDPAEVTDVVFSHQHIDHTLNAALFPNARYHDYAAIYRDDLWSDSEAEGRVLSDGIRLIGTPGHTVEDISTVVQTDRGVVVCTHAWWSADGPDEDPYAPDMDVLRRSRDRIRALDPALIIPGHGAGFAPR